MTIAWVCLLIVGVGILAFGFVAVVMPMPTEPLMRTAGVASIGMGVFGIVITAIPFRHRERWAWYVMWCYPLFWIAHLLGRLPPGNDHVHQVIFIVLSVSGLLVSLRTFFRGPPPGTEAGASVDTV
jgi:hypothetical protein